MDYNIQQRSSASADRKRFGRVYLWWIQRLRAKEKHEGRKDGLLARDVLCALASYADKRSGQCWPAIETIAEDLCISQKSVKAAMRILCTAGIVHKQSRNRCAGESNLYALAVDGQPFQVTHEGAKNVDVQRGGVTEPIRSPDRDGLGHHPASFQVTHGGANNPPGNLINEPSVPRARIAFARAQEASQKVNENDEPRRELMEALGQCGLDLRKADLEASRLQRWFPGAHRRLIGHLRYAADNGIENPITYAERQTRYGNDPATSAISEAA